MYRKIFNQSDHMDKKCNILHWNKILIHSFRLAQFVAPYMQIDIRTPFFKKGYFLLSKSKSERLSCLINKRVYPHRFFDDLTIFHIMQFNSVWVERKKKYFMPKVEKGQSFFKSVFKVKIRKCHLYVVLFIGKKSTTHLNSVWKE